MTTQTSPSAPTGRSPTPSGGAPRLPRIRTVLLSAVSTSSVSGARPGDVLPRGGGDGPSPESRLNGSRHRGDGPTPRGNTEKGCSRRSWSGCGTTVPGRGPTSLSTRRPRSAAAPWTSASPASVKRSVTRQRVYVIVCLTVSRVGGTPRSSGSCRPRRVTPRRRSCNLRARRHRDIREGHPSNGMQAPFIVEVSS